MKVSVSSFPAGSSVVVGTGDGVGVSLLVGVGVGVGSGVTKVFGGTAEALGVVPTEVLGTLGVLFGSTGLLADVKVMTLMLMIATMTRPKVM